MSKIKSDDLVPSAHDFTGNLEDWEDRVFLNAVGFRLHRFYGRGKVERAETKSFVQAMVMADDAKKEGKRVLVYAITEQGRFIALIEKRWNHYAELFLRRQAETEAARKT